jgi:hypothetical protein
MACATMADCDDYEDIAAWGAAHLDFLRERLAYEHGVPGERWLTILMNRINPALFAAAFADWVRESWPEKADPVAIDGKTSRRSHVRGAGAGPLHLVSAFATTACRQVGPIVFREPLKDGERVFDERRSLVFKRLQVVRFFDRERNVLVYVAYSDRIITGAPQNSLSSVPLMPWAGVAAKPM